jgi:transposase, IS5 family
MNQTILSVSGFELKSKNAGRRELLGEMDRVIPWGELVALIQPHALLGKTGRPPFGVEQMLHIHLLQQLFGHANAAMEEMLYDIPLYREFAHIDVGCDRVPDESTILRFRHLLEVHGLAQTMFDALNAQLLKRGLMFKTGTVVDATLIEAPSSTKNQEGTRDPEMHQTKKGNQWHFDAKVGIGADAESGLVHTVVVDAANVHDLIQLPKLLHGQEEVVYADSGYRGVGKREEITEQHPNVQWNVAMQPAKRKKLKKQGQVGKIVNQIEWHKAMVRAKLEHPFRAIKRQFDHTRLRYRGLVKNAAQLFTMFALSNLWMVRKVLIKKLNEKPRTQCVCKWPKGHKCSSNTTKTGQQLLKTEKKLGSNQLTLTSSSN